MWNSTSQRVDVFERPLMDKANFAFQHGDVRFGRRVVKIDDQRKGVVLIEKERVVVVLLDHVANPVLVSINGGVDPPALILFLGHHRHGCGESEGGRQHQGKAEYGDGALKHGCLLRSSHFCTGFQSIGTVFGKNPSSLELKHNDGCRVNH